MPDYQLQEDEEFIRRNYSNNQNRARKRWRQNPTQNNPVLMMEAQENRSCVLDSELQVSPSGRLRTNLSSSQNVTGSTPELLERRSATVADNEPRLQPSLAPAGYPAPNHNTSSFLIPNPSFGSSSENCDLGALSVVSGYQSCASEALRYLMEEEGLKSDDSLVAGLRQHLEAQQRLLDPEGALRNYLAAMARLMANEEDSDDITDAEEDYGDVTDAEVLSEFEDDEQMDEKFRHLASSILSGMCDESYYNGFVSNEDESDTDSEVRWFDAGAPSTYEPMCEEYSYDATGAPSPSPSI